SVPGQRAFRGFVPGTGTERRWAWAVAFTSGVCEELLIRGLLVAAGVSAGLAPAVAVLFASALFGLLHLYQGWLAVLGTSALGVTLSGFYLASGSLMFPIILHVLLDVRAMLLIPMAKPATEAHHAPATTS